MQSYLTPNWPVSKEIKAYTTTRLDGFSQSPYDSFNLATHVGDSPIAVTKNRQKLYRDLQLPYACCWLKQVHKNRVIHVENWHAEVEADGCYSDQPNQVCLVLTGDCLPILLCDKNGKEVAALHGGWRSLAQNIIEQGLQYFRAKRSNIFAWLGPCISTIHYPVGNQVREKILATNQMLARCFYPHKTTSNWYFSLAECATLQLNSAGIKQIYGKNLCTFSQLKQFFSYRRQAQTGRMASLIYFSHS